MNQTPRMRAELTEDEAFELKTLIDEQRLDDVFDVKLIDPAKLAWRVYKDGKMPEEADLLWSRDISQRELIDNWMLVAGSGCPACDDGGIWHSRRKMLVGR